MLDSNVLGAKLDGLEVTDAASRLNHAFDRADETARLRALRRLAVLDTAPEEAFDRIAGLVAQAFAAPVALISFIDENRQWFKARVGLDVAETPRVTSFCSHAIAGDGVFCVPDATLDPVFSDNPLVTKAPKIRFYAGAPLKTAGGHALGTVCIIDTKPRPALTVEERKTLASFAPMVLEELDERLSRHAETAIEAKTAIRATTAQLAQFLEQSSDMIMRCRPDGICRYVSAACRRTLGVEPGDLVGGDVVSSVHPADKELMRAALHRVGEMGSKAELRYRLQHHHGNWVWLEGTAIWCRGPETGAFELLITVRDVTDRVEAEDASRESEARYRLLADHSSDVIIRGVLNGPRSYVSPSVREMLGYEPEQLVGGEHLDLIHPDDLERFTAARLQLRPSEPGHPGISSEHRIRRADGSYLWVDCHVTAFTAPNGDIEFRSALRDVDRRHNSEAALRASEETFKLLFESNPVPMWVRDCDTLRFSKVNEAAIAHYGYTAEQWHSMKPADIEMPGEGPSRGRVRSVRHRCADGRIIDVEEVARSLAYQGQPSELAALFDVTERNRVKDEYRAAQLKAEEASQAKSQFLANMSHELRTPLNAILGFSEVIRDSRDPMDPRVRDYASHIHDSGRRLLEVISDILDLSNIEVNQLDLEESTVDLAAVVESCRRLMAEKAGKAGVALAVFIDTKMPPIYADELRLKQVLLNLLSNAVKFTPAGGKIDVAIGLGLDRCVELKVTDTGIGMTAAQIPLALERFQQLDNSTSRAAAGIGLGLPLAKRLVELHGGTLEISSEPHRGMEICVRLPEARILDTEISPDLG